jgi:AraC family transcriptional regulator
MSVSVADGQFFGRVHRTRRFAGLSLTETSYCSGAHVPTHAHANSLFCLVVRGGFLERTGRHDRPVGAGSVLFHPRDVPHSHQFVRTTSRCLSVQLGEEWLTRFDGLSGVTFDSPADVRGHRLNWLAMSLYREFCANDAASELAVEGLALAILADFTRAREPRESLRPVAWARTVRDVLEARYVERIRLSELASIVGVHPVHLSRVFRRQFGCTLTEYVRRLRITQASRALLTTNESLASIALAAGFADQGHFTRRFKEMTGMTPGAYRATAGRSAAGDAGLSGHRTGDVEPAA